MVHSKHAQSSVATAEQKRHPAATRGIPSPTGAENEGREGRNRRGESSRKGRQTKAENQRLRAETGQANCNEATISTDSVPVQLATVRLDKRLQSETLLLKCHDRHVSRCYLSICCPIVFNLRCTSPKHSCYKKTVTLYPRQTP